jgi:hypothetical protein
MPRTIELILKVSERLASLRGIPENDDNRRLSQLQTLCSLASTSPIPWRLFSIHDQVNWIYPDGWNVIEYPDNDVKYNLRLEFEVMVAATYFEEASMVEKLAIQAWKGFRDQYRTRVSTSLREKNASVFGHPFELIGASGNLSIICSVLQDIPEDSSENSRRHITHSILNGAAKAGKYEAVRFLLIEEIQKFGATMSGCRIRDLRNHPVYAIPAYTTRKDIFGLFLASQEGLRAVGIETLPLSDILRMIWGPEREVSNEELIEHFQRCVLGRQILEGNLEMIQYLFEEGYPGIAKTFCMLEKRLFCSRADLKVLRLVSKHMSFHGTGGIAAAARAGRFEVVKFLLETGCDINEHLWGHLSPAIVQAVLQEDEDMFRYLLDHGAILDDKFAAEAVGRAKAAGIDSMLTLLSNKGIKIDGFPRINHKSWEMYDPNRHSYRCQKTADFEFLAHLHGICITK